MSNEDAKGNEEAESGEERKDEDVTDDTAALNNEEFAEPAQQDQQAYLEPILVAMELGQEILQGNAAGDEEQVSDEHMKLLIIIFTFCTRGDQCHYLSVLILLT